MSTENKPSIEKIIQQETERRLDIMEKPDYHFPEPLGKIDWIAITFAILLCLILIAVCMLEDL